MRRLKNIGLKVLPFTFFLAFLLIWQMCAQIDAFEKEILSSPLEIWFTSLAIFPDIKEHIWITLKEALIGIFLSIGMAYSVALFMDRFEVLKKVLYPSILVSQNIPIIALAPLFTLWFGFGIVPKIIVVVLVCFFPILISLIEGLRSVDEDLIHLFKTMGANSAKIYRYVKLPASLPYFFSGLKIAITYSIMGAVIAEWLGGSGGLGIYMLRVKHQYSYSKVYAVTFILVILCLILYYIVDFLHRKFEPWKKFEETGA